MLNIEGNYKLRWKYQLVLLHDRYAEIDWVRRKGSQASAIRKFPLGRTVLPVKSTQKVRSARTHEEYAFPSIHDAAKSRLGQGLQYAVARLPLPVWLNILASGMLFCPSTFAPVPRP